MVMIDWNSVEALKTELETMGLTRTRAEVRKETPPPFDRQAGEGSGTGSPHPHAQNHNKSVEQISTHGKLLKPEETQIGGSHYKGLAIQPMRYSMLNGLNACQHTAIKYVTRYKDKGGTEDLRKAIHCIELLIQFELEEQENNDKNKNNQPEETPDPGTPAA